METRTEYNRRMAQKRMKAERLKRKRLKKLFTIGGTLLLLFLVSIVLDIRLMRWLVALLALGCIIYVGVARLPGRYKSLFALYGIGIIALAVVPVLLTVAQGNESSPQQAAAMDEAVYAESPTPNADLVTLQQAASLDTPAPELTPSPSPVPTPTPVPTPVPTQTPFTDMTGGEHHGIPNLLVLFYSEQNTSIYHLNNNCPGVQEQYLPLKATLYYEDLAETKYKSMQPCAICSAPARPHSH